MRYAIINTTTNVIENVVDYESTPSNPPPGFADNYIAVQNDGVGTNWTYANGELVAPVVTPFIIPLPQAAQTALTKTDTTMLRVQEAITLGLTTATTADVVAFVHYRKALRAIVDGTDTTSTSLPAQPAYPANT